MLTELDHRILQTVLQEGEPISSQRLSMLCGAAVNTIRKEIASLNREMENEGFRIEMKSSVGVYPVILDAKRALPYINRLRTFYNRSHHLEKQHSDRVNALTRRCLCAGSGVTVERLCEEFYCSRSTVLRELEEVREILGEFRLTLKNRRGLRVEGSEWDLRQCLVYQHKIYMIRGEGDDRDNYPGQRTFRAQFFMDEESYETVFSIVMNHLLEEERFSLPSIHVPKLTNMILLCRSRQKRAGQLVFPKGQMKLVRGTAEDEFIETLCQALPPRFRDCMGEAEKALLTMILLGFDERKEGREEFMAEAKDLVSCLCGCFGFCPADFDSLFYADFSCYLSRLENRRAFGILGDPEPVGQVRYLGITSANLCLAFARFYRQRHGISLSPTDAMGCFYILNRAIGHKTYCYYAQRLLVSSELGLDNARAMADKLVAQHGETVEKILPLPCSEVHRHWGEGWDLLVTDMPEQKYQRYFPRCPIPILTLEFQLFERPSESLMAYLDRIKQQKRLEIMDAESFFRTDLGGKEEVFSFLESRLAGDIPGDLAPLSGYLRENDTLLDMERGNGVVFLPVFTAGACRSRVIVLINRTPLLWNRKKAQIFVCCVYSDSFREGKIIASILHRFVYMTPETQQKLLQETTASPLLALYPDE